MCRKLVLLISLVSVLALASVASAAPVEPGAPLGEWSFDETSGTTAADNIGTNDGVVSMGSGSWNTDGKFNGSLQSNDSAVVAVPVAVLSSLSDAFSFAWWMKGNDNQWGDTSAAFKVSDASLEVISVWSPHANGNFYFDVTDGADRVSTSRTESDMEGTWRHWAVTKGGGEMRIYMDGVEIASGSGMNETVSDLTEFIIGGRADQSAAVRASIDEFAVWGSMLSTGNVEWLAGIPEPMTIALLGLGGLFLRRRK